MCNYQSIPLLKIKYFIIVCWALGSNELSAQVFGGNPAHTQWRQINSPQARVIFPKSADSAGQRVANIVQWEQTQDSFSIGKTVKKINIVLQPEVTYSNGYVGLGPFRSEFYLMPSIDAFSLGALPPVDNLAIHENRHVQQYANFHVGLSKYASWIFGQNGQALFNAMAVPNWFFEGDAVYNETRLSRQGRGRIPLFLNNFRALQMGKKDFSYQKWRNGSYRDFVPNHYPLGYLLVSYGYARYGAHFWQKVTHDAAAFNQPIYPFQSAIKKYTGIHFQQFVKDAFNFYQKEWPVLLDTTAAWLTPIRKNNVANYNFPQTVGQNIIAAKTDYRHIPQFVTWENGREKHIGNQSIAYDNYFSVHDSLLVYAGYKPDLRWGNKEYSEIRVLNLNTQKEIVLRRGTRYFTPDIKTENGHIIVSEINDNQNSALVILNKNGSVVEKIAAPQKEIFTYPKFLPQDNAIILVVRNAAGEMGIRKINLQSLQAEMLIPFANHLIGFPNVVGDTLIYAFSSNGKDALRAYLFAEKKSILLSSYATGLYQGTLLHGKLYASAFTADGYRLGNFPQSGATANSLDSLGDAYGIEHDLKNVGSVHNEELASSNYNKWTNPINFHSLQPDLDDPNYSLTLYGENILNTWQTNLSYNYNRNEKFSSVGISTVYGGWYVQPIVGMNGTFQRSAYDSKNQLHYWNEYNIAGGLQLPLNLSQGKMYRYLNISSLVRYNQVYWTGASKNVLRNYDFTYQDSRISYSAQIQQAQQQLFPHFAYSVAAQWRYGYTASAGQLLLTGNVYLPGMMSTHSVVLNGAWARRDTLGNYSFSNNFPISRGYSSINYPQMWKLGANYYFPVAYPDWGVGSIVYFLRLRGNVYYDYSQLKSLRYQRSYNIRSMGAELFFDTRWWNQEPVTFGIRYARLIDHRLLGIGANRWEFILPVNLFH